jgi:predicted nucleotidyltransferase
MPLLERLTEVLHGLPGVRLAAAFGSVARGQAHTRSDVDLAVVLEPDTAEQRLDVAAALERGAGRPLDLIHLDAAPPLLRFEIARDGILLLERHPHEWADFRTRAMLDWWDWAPLSRMIGDAAIRRLREKVDATHGPS